MIIVKNRLQAGFFSNFNAALGWLWYSMITEVPVYISWGGLPNKNIFELFFIQKHVEGLATYTHNANIQHSPLFTYQIKESLRETVGERFFDKYEGWFFCRGEVYTEPEFETLRRFYNYIYTENLSFNHKSVNISDIPPNTLGVNYRYINFFFADDGRKTPFMDLMSTEEYHKKYTTQLESVFEKGNYDYIYLSTSQQLIHDICKEKFKDKLLYIPMKRLEENKYEIHRGVPLEVEYADVIKDVFNLTRCDHLLCSPSNLMFAVLYFNPSTTYEVFDFLKHVHTG